MGQVFVASFICNILHGLKDLLLNKVAAALVPCVLLAWQQTTANCWLKWPQSGAWAPPSGSSTPRSGVRSSWSRGHRWRRTQLEVQGPKPTRKRREQPKSNSLTRSPCWMQPHATTWMKVSRIIHTGKRLESVWEHFLEFYFNLNFICPDVASTHRTWWWFFWRRFVTFWINSHKNWGLILPPSGSNAELGIRLFS